MKLKKMLAATLAAAMVMSSAMVVSASGYDDSSESVETVEVVTVNVPVTVAGTEVKTSVAGAYAATSVQGVAVTASVETVKASLGLTEGQEAAITVYDTDPVKSPKALASVNAAAEALGAEVLTSLNIDLGAKQDGKWVELDNGSVALTTGLPKDADLTKEYVAICVQPGGKTTIFEDLDPDPATITFEVQAGIGTYAIAAK